MATSLQLPQKLFQFYNLHTNDEKLVKFSPVLAEIVGMICRFLPAHP